MAIVQTFGKNQFIDAFQQSSRKGQFSYAALEAIFDHLEDYSEQTGQNVDFDLIGICCEWAELNWADIAEDYKINLSDCETDEERIEEVEYFMSERTTILPLGDGDFVYIQF